MFRLPPQSISSELSVQSVDPSHLEVADIHWCDVTHVNSSVEQVAGASEKMKEREKEREIHRERELRERERGEREREKLEKLRVKEREIEFVSVCRRSEYGVIGSAQSLFAHRPIGSRFSAVNVMQLLLPIIYELITSLEILIGMPIWSSVHNLYFQLACL